MRKHYKILSILIFFISLFISKTYSQVNLEWERLYPEQYINYATAHALIIDDTGNIFVGGTIQKPLYGAEGYFTIKYSNSGFQQWATNYFGPTSTSCDLNSISLDKNNNVYITGYFYGNDYDFCTIKYNNSGVQQWVRYYDGPFHGFDEAQKISVDNAGNIYVAGSSQDSTGYYTFTIIKYNTNGDQLFVKRFGHGYSAGVYGLKTDDSCNIYLTGYTSISDSSGAFTIKYDSSGIRKWIAYVGNFGPRALCLDNDRNLYISGIIQGISTIFDFYTIKYTNTGIIQWSKRFNFDTVGNWDSEAFNIALDNSNNIYVSGSTKYSSGPVCISCIKYSNSGDLLWTKKDTTPINYPTNVNMGSDSTNNIYVSGTAYSGILILKYDSSGYQVWKTISEADESNAIAVDDNFNIFVAGNKIHDAITLKHSQLVNIANNENSIPFKYFLFQNYPNPFNSSTKIKFEIPKSGHIKLIVYNLLGQKVTELVNRYLKQGNFEFEWLGIDYPSGIYICELIYENYFQVRKMILLK